MLIHLDCNKKMMQSTSWVSKSSYPFTSRYFDIDGHQMHYVDEGEGEPVVFVHGTPTWSYLYRSQIQFLSANHRCIAADHMGFGLSDKPAGYDYAAKNLARNLERFLDALKLEAFTLVVHDFGGPIGLNYALKHPDKVSKIVMFNTWMWSNEGVKEIEKADRFFRSKWGGWLFRRFNLSPRLLLPKGFADASKLTASIKQHYLKPFDNPKERYGTLGIAKSLMGNNDWYTELWNNRFAIQDIPTLILWGNQDPFFNLDQLDRWRSFLTNDTLHMLDCGHFPQEELPETVSQKMHQFIGEKITIAVN